VIVPHIRSGDPTRDSHSDLLGDLTNLKSGAPIPKIQKVFGALNHEFGGAGSSRPRWLLGPGSRSPGIVKKRATGLFLSGMDGFCRCSINPSARAKSRSERKSLVLRLCSVKSRAAAQSENPVILYRQNEMLETLFSLFPI